MVNNVIFKILFENTLKRTIAQNCIDSYSNSTKKTDTNIIMTYGHIDI